MKRRNLYNKIHRYLSHKNAIIITGMRQVGKTTLMKQFFDEIEGAKLWFDFENPLDTMYFEDKDYSNIHQKLVSMANSEKERLFIFIDEVQNFPDITRIVKYHIDHYNVKYILTGSSNFYLKNLFPESLSGRKFLFVLSPLTFTEYLYFNDKCESPAGPHGLDELILKGKEYTDYKEFDSEYRDYLEYGGFPEVALTSDKETKTLILRNIFSSFFEKDLGILTDLQDIRELRDLILLLVPRVGNMLDVSRLASELGVQRTKVYQYLEFLQGVFFIDLIPKFSKSIDRSVAGGRKVYFADNGLLKIAGKITDGQQFENSIANQLKAYGELCFYNKRNTAEIDFIVNKEYAFEVKVRGIEKDILKLHKLSQEIGLSSYHLISREYLNHEKAILPMMI